MPAVAGVPVPAIMPVTGPVGVVLTPSAPILSLVNTLPVAGVPESSATAPMSAVAIGTSFIIAIFKNLSGVTLLAVSLIDTAKSSVTGKPVVGAVFSV